MPNRAQLSGLINAWLLAAAGFSWRQLAPWLQSDPRVHVLQKLMVLHLKMLDDFSVQPIGSPGLVEACVHLGASSQQRNAPFWGGGGVIQTCTMSPSACAPSCSMSCQLPLQGSASSHRPQRDSARS